MDITTGRPNHIQDYLVTVHGGTWFGFSDINNKTYSTLILIDDTKTLPTEAECNQGLADLQAEFDANAYKDNRKNEYPDIGDQLDDLFKAGAFSDEMTATLQAVKDKYPKE